MIYEVRYETNSERGVEDFVQTINIRIVETVLARLQVPDKLGGFHLLQYLHILVSHDRWKRLIREKEI